MRKLRDRIYISIVQGFYDPNLFTASERQPDGSFKTVNQFPRSELESNLDEYRSLGLAVQPSYSCPGGFSVFEEAQYG